MDETNIVYVETILDESQTQEIVAAENAFQNPDNETLNNKPVHNTIDSKNCAVWTTSATLTLLKLYESKIDNLTSPKKKTGMWLALSEDLKQFNIEMTPDQVRWKINALTKKYKQCIYNGQHKSFKFFNELHNIYKDGNEDDYTISELIQKKKEIGKNQLNNLCDNITFKPRSESKAMLELRKIRLANRIEYDRTGGKIKLEKQWLDYLKKQEEHKQFRDEIYERTLKLREQELELRKKELEVKESLEIKKIQIKEKEQEEVLIIERQKCEMLQRIVTNKLLLK